MIRSRKTRKDSYPFFSCEKKRKNKSEGRLNNANSDGETVSSSSSTTKGTITPTENRSTVVSTTRQCIVCSSTKTYGPRGKWKAPFCIRLRLSMMIKNLS